MVLAVCISCPACNNSCFDNGRSGGISSGTGQVCPTRRGNPGQHTRLRLFEPPSLKLLDPMVMPAERCEIAFAGQATLFERNGMVVVALGGGHPAARRGAALIADLYQMPQRWRRPVIEAFPFVAAFGWKQSSRTWRRASPRVPDVREWGSLD